MAKGRLVTGGGRSKFFDDQTYHIHTLRALGDIPYGGAENSLIQVRSVTSVVYERESGGSEHCQVGAATLWHATFFNWLLQKFPTHAEPLQ